MPCIYYAKLKLCICSPSNRLVTRHGLRAIASSGQLGWAAYGLNGMNGLNGCSSCMRYGATNIIIATTRTGRPDGPCVSCRNSFWNMATQTRWASWKGWTTSSPKRHPGRPIYWTRKNWGTSPRIAGRGRVWTPINMYTCILYLWITYKELY